MKAARRQRLRPRNLPVPQLLRKGRCMPACATSMWRARQKCAASPVARRYRQPTLTWQRQRRIRKSLEAARRTPGYERTAQAKGNGLNYSGRQHRRLLRQTGFALRLRSMWDPLRDEKPAMAGFRRVIASLLRGGGFSP